MQVINTKNYEQNLQLKRQTSILCKSLSKLVKPGTPQVNTTLLRTKIH